VSTYEPPAYEDLMDMTDDQRVALPAEHHRPVFDGLGEPHSWICAVCWGDGWQTSWPCEAATVGGVDLGRSLGVQVVR
jgi:hypothetical protein